MSIIPLVCFSVILFKSNKMSDISNITIFALSIIYILFSLLSMYLHPYRYTSLLSPYRVTRVSLLTPSLLLLMSVPCSVIICVGGWWVWVGVGVLGGGIIFFVVVRPHAENKNNVRSVFNYGVICVFVGFKYHAAKLSHYNLPEDPTVVFIFISVLLCFICVIVSLLFHFYVFV